MNGIVCGVVGAFARAARSIRIRSGAGKKRARADPANQAFDPRSRSAEGVGWELGTASGNSDPVAASVNRESKPILRRRRELTSSWRHDEGVIRGTPHFTTVVLRFPMGTHGNGTRQRHHSRVMRAFNKVNGVP